MRRRGGGGRRGGHPLPTGSGVWGGGCAPSPEKFLNFYIKMVSSGAFWVAINYRLAACFIPESDVRVELNFIGDHSDILGTIMTLWGKFRGKTDKK